MVSCDICALNVIGRICCDAGVRASPPWTPVEVISGALIMEERVKPSRVRFHMYIAISVF